MFENSGSHGFYIEQATEKDIPALSELLRVLFTLEQDFTPQVDKQQRGLGLLLEGAPRSCVLVARRVLEQQVLGMITAQLVISTAEGGLSAWIEDVVVDPNYQSQGIGSALIQGILDWSVQQGAKRAQLLVDKDNQPAVSFYDALKWRKTQLQARQFFFS